MSNSANILLACLLATLAAGCQSTNPMQRGTAVGGLAGGALGAVVGAAVDQPVEGAAIGAGVGALSGAAIGRAEEQKAIAVETATIDAAEVVRLVQAGVGPSIITQQIHTQGVIARPTTEDILYLQQNGVAEPIISALQTAPLVVVAKPPPVRTAVVVGHPVPRRTVVAPRVVVPAPRRRARRYW